MSKRLFFRSIAINYLFLLVSFLLNVCLTPVILAYLGKTAYGLWAIFSSIVTYLILFDFGINTSVSKYTSEYIATQKHQELKALISTILVVFSLIGVAVILFGLLITAFLPGIFSIPGYLIVPAKIAFLLITVNVALMLIGGIFGNIIYGLQRVDIWKSIGVVQLLLNALLTVVLLKLGLGIVGLALALLISSIILVFLYWVFLRKNRYNIEIRLNLLKWSVLRKIIPYSLRTFILGLSSRVLYYTDNIVIGIFLGAALVTPYDIAYKLCFLTTYLFSTISTNFFPIFSKLYALQDIKQLGDLYLRILKVSLAIMTPLAILLFFFGNTFIDLWVGQGNFVGPGAFTVLIIMTFFHAIGTPSAMLIQSTGKNKEMMYSEIINAILNLALSIFLISKLGLIGVALGTLIAHICTSFWVVAIQACKQSQVTLKKYFTYGIFPPLGIGFFVFFVARFLEKQVFFTSKLLTLSINGFTVLLVYGVCFWIFGMNSAEKRSVYSLVHNWIDKRRMFR